MKWPFTGKRGARPGRPAEQYGALPFRRGAEGLQILLITSRETRRWVIPKGWPMKGRKPYAAAAREALEEAGVTGRIGKGSLGVYGYLKHLKNGQPVPCNVRVFPLEVLSEHESWAEMTQRLRRWFPAAEAAEAVEEPELSALILKLAEPQAPRKR